MYTPMGVPGSCRSLGLHLKSASLRTNEELVRLCNDFTEVRRLCFQRPHVFDDDRDLGLGVGDLTRRLNRDVYRQWERFHNLLRDVDQRMKRVESLNALVSAVLAGIMLQLEQRIIPVMRKFILFDVGQSLYVSNWSAMFLIFDLQDLLEDLVEAVPECLFSESLESAHKVVVSALELLSFVYQYLVGCVDKGGSKSYSAGSFLFRLIFVAIVLFLGSYVWIKFRQASHSASRRKRKSADESDVPGGVYRRAVKKDSIGTVTRYKYEPRFKPLREKLESGASLEFNFLSLGSYDTRHEAEMVLLIAAFLYGEVEGRPVQFQDGVRLPFPSVTGIENCPPSGKERAVWVTHKTKDLYAKLLREKALLPPAVKTDSHHGRDGEVCRSDPSPSAPDAPSTAKELACFTSPNGGNGVVDQPGTSECHGLGQESLPDQELFSASSPDRDIDQFISSMLQPEDNDFPAVDKVVGDCSVPIHVFGFESTSVASHSSALDILTPAGFANLQQVRVRDQGFEIIEPHLNSATAISFQQWESLPEQVQLQQHVTYQEEHPKEFSGSNVELQQKLRESEERNSQLQQMLHQYVIENEKLRSMFREVAKLI